MKRIWISFISCLPLADTTVIIQKGNATAKRGKLRSILLSDLSELAHSNNIQDACIHADLQGSTFKLSLYGIPKNFQQRVFNVWSSNWK